MVVGAFLSCNEQYDFNVLNQSPGIVIESQISNVSFDESLNFPSDGRYFEVILSRTSNVNNIRDEKISGARVELEDSKGERWSYEENRLSPGQYVLKNSSFKALQDVRYRLTVRLETGQEFQSNWETMPVGVNPEASFHIEEDDPLQYVYEGQGERVIKNVKGFHLATDLPKVDQKQYYRWTFDPLWVYVATLIDDLYDPNRHCWVTSDYYLDEYILAETQNVPIHERLFFLPVRSNFKIFYYFSSLIHQDVVSEGYYNFWRDIEGQKDKGGLFDQPPYSIQTNFSSLNSDWTVNGYFGVVSEKTIRWEFDPSELSYVLDNNLREFCEENAQLDPRLDPDPCYDCRYYNMGEAVNIPPKWWTKNVIYN